MRKQDHSLWKAAQLKNEQLEREIRRSAATDVQQNNMQHTRSKLWMFVNDAMDELLPKVFDDDECPGRGKCHGAMDWCDNCGSVRNICDAPPCDAHPDVGNHG